MPELNSEILAKLLEEYFDKDTYKEFLELDKSLYNDIAKEIIARLQ